MQSNFARQGKIVCCVKVLCHSGRITDRTGHTMKLSPLSALAAAILCLAAAPAIAQQSDAKPFRLQTALDLPDWLKVSGSIRPRYESLANQFVAGRSGGDDYFAV